MKCNQCGELVELVDSKGATDQGHFVERYECIQCGGMGAIRGSAEASPDEWTSYGVCR